MGDMLRMVLRKGYKYCLCCHLKRTSLSVLMFGLFITLSVIIAVLTVYYTSLKPSKTCQFTFERIGKSSIITSSQPQSVAAGDLNNDNQLDIVVADSGTDALSIFFSYTNGTFGNQKIYPTGFQSLPYSVILQDFNNDQNLDIAVANYGSHTIGVFLGYGNGDFADQIKLSTGSAHPLFIIAGDFNNDNRSDIAVANYGTNNVGIFLGDGGGFFQVQATYFTGYDSLPNSLALGDFNNDNYSDIAIANYGTNNIGILLGYGNGSFASLKTFTTGPSSYPSSVAVGDFNKDNYLDIAVVNYGNSSVGILLGHGNGTFKVQTSYSTGFDARPRYITVSHVSSNDNELDIIIADTENDRIYILPGDDNGTFVILSTYDMIPGSSPLSIVVADYDGDNQSDVIVANFGTNNVLIFSGYTNVPSARQSNYSVSPDANPTATVIYDFNNDNHLDIVVNDYTNSSLLLLIGYGNGIFISEGIYSTGDGSLPQYISIGDFNNDDRMDIVTANSGSDSVGVLLGQDNIYFGAVATYFIGVGAGPYCVAVGDINNDKQLDIVSANSGTSSISIFLGNGNGTFVIIGTYGTGSYSIPYSVAVGDVNNDHRIDIIVTDFINNCVGILLGHNNGFLPVTAYLTGDNSYPISLALADLNGDSYLDIIVADVFGDSLSILLGIGNGSFETQMPYPTGLGSQPYSVIAVDYNSDNVPDIAATLLKNDVVIVFFGYGNGSFYLARNYSTGFGSEPYGINFADFDKDKQLEIVVTLFLTGNIAILTEYDAAQFESKTIYSTGSAPHSYSVATGDFNNDNRSDLVVANSGNDDVDILFSLGNGTFDKRTTYLTGINSNPQYVVTRDINQDNQLDIVVVYSGTDAIGIMMGYGNGSFLPSTIYSTGTGSHPSTIIFGDLNNDNQSDIVVVNEGANNVGIFFKFDYVTFESQKTYSSEGIQQPWSIVVNDFNNDNYLDIAFTCFGSDNVGILLGHGNGSFDVMITFPTGDNSNPIAMAVADFNKDNILDLTIVNAALNNIAIFFGYGNGTFGSMLTFSTGDDSLPYAVTLGDFNNDGQLDMAVANYKSNNIGILLGCGNGSFGIVVLYPTGYNSVPVAIATADFNNNGQLDIVVANSVAYNVGIFLGYGNGTFANQVTYPAGPAFQVSSVAVGYLNSDNYIDIVISNYNGKTVAVLLGDGNGTFTDVTMYSTGGSQPNYVSIGDLNNDNRSDIVVANFGSDSIVVLSGFGDGTFLLGKTYPTGVRSTPIALALGDFNNDTRLDVAVADQSSNNIGVFLRYGSEPFANIITLDTGDGSKPHSAAVGDFNNDGRADIVVANLGIGNVGIFLGCGSRKFNAMISYPTGPVGSAPYSVSIGDFNNDSQSDIVVSNSEIDNVAILLGFGNGTFALPALYSTGARSRPYTVSIADFNNDNIMDIVVANSGTNNIFLLYGNGNGTFGNEKLYSLGYNYLPYSITVDDLNRDGWMDIITACYNTDNVEILMKMCI